MDAKYACPHCQQRIAMAEPQAGATIQCPTCGVDFILPRRVDSSAFGRLFSPWIWCAGAILAVGITVVYFHRSSNRGVTEKPPSRQTVAPTQAAARSVQGAYPDKPVGAWVEDLKSLDTRTANAAIQYIQ